MLSTKLVSHTCSMNMAFALAAFSGTKSVNQSSFWDGLTAIKLDQIVLYYNQFDVAFTYPLQAHMLGLNPCDFYTQPSFQVPSQRCHKSLGAIPGTLPNAVPMPHNMGWHCRVLGLFRVRVAAGTHGGSIVVS